MAENNLERYFAPAYWRGTSRYCTKSYRQRSPIPSLSHLGLVGRFITELLPMDRCLRAFCRRMPHAQATMASTIYITMCVHTLTHAYVCMYVCMVYVYIYMFVLAHAQMLCSSLLQWIPVTSKKTCKCTDDCVNEADGHQDQEQKLIGMDDYHHANCNWLDLSTVIIVMFMLIVVVVIIIIIGIAIFVII